MNFKLKQSNIVHEGKVFDLKVDEIEYDSGNKAIREVAVHPGGAVVIPVTGEGKLVMVTQFRYPFQKTLLEFPAGKLDEGEDPLKCAVRELEEETGYRSENVKKIGEIYTAPGYCTETLSLFVARDLKKGDHNREEGEYGMEMFEFYPEEVEKKVKAGKIFDAKTICGFYILKG
jgi:ADP-ribose pyrophosphatase